MHGVRRSPALRTPSRDPQRDTAASRLCLSMRGAGSRSNVGADSGSQPGAVLRRSLLRIRAALHSI